MSGNIFLYIWTILSWFFVTFYWLIKWILNRSIFPSISSVSIFDLWSSLTGHWLVNTCHMTWILASDWLRLTSHQRARSQKIILKRFLILIESGNPEKSWTSLTDNTAAWLSTEYFFQKKKYILQLSMLKLKKEKFIKKISSQC